MMYCYSCGKTFPDEDVVKKRDGETAMHIFCCPNCGRDDIGETEVCKGCGEDLPEEDLSHGYCLQCLWDAVDYDIALEYMKYREELCTFIMCDWFGASKPYSDYDASHAYKVFMEETFRRLVASDKLMLQFGAKPDFLVACKYFCLPKYPNSFGLDGSEFADWYNDRNMEESKK